MNFADLGVSEQNKFCFYRLRQQLLFELQYLYVYMPVCCTLLFVLQEKLMLTTSHPYTQPFPTETAVPTAAVPRGVTAVAWAPLWLGLTPGRARQLSRSLIGSLTSGRPFRSPRGGHRALLALLHLGARARYRAVTACCWRGDVSARGG